MTAKRIEQYLKYAMIALVILIVILGLVFVHEYIILHHEQLLNAHQLALFNFLKQHRGPLTAADVTIIRPWMTFDYINRLFNVSSTYLQTSLSIQDPHYPRLSLYGYANYEHQNVETLTSQVENSLSAYLTVTEGSTTTN